MVLVKYSHDKRYDDSMICTHDMQKMKAISATRIFEVYDQLLGHDVIGIDEGQFFEDIAEMAEDLVQMGKLVKEIFELDNHFWIR